MQFKFTPQLIKKISKLKRQQPKTFQKIQKQLTIFQANSRHPSLRTHKLTGQLKNSFSISIERNLRMIYYLTENKQTLIAVFFALGTHDQVYR